MNLERTPQNERQFLSLTLTVRGLPVLIMLFQGYLQHDQLLVIPSD